MSFVHLHRHSEYSTLDGLGTADQYAARAVELGQHALALTDHGNLCGALEHIKACEKYGLHPIVGMEAYFRPDRHADVPKEKRYHMVLLASGLKGWHSLMRLSSQAHADGWYYSPCIDYDLLEEYNEGLFCTTACISGYAAHHLIHQSEEGDLECDKHLTRLQNIFGENLFAEIQPALFDNQVIANKRLIGRANSFGLPILASVDAHYVMEEHADTHDNLWLMTQQSSHAERAAKLEKGEKVMDHRDSKLFLMDEQRVYADFAAHHPEIPLSIVDSAIQGTEELAAKINPFVLNKSLKLPRLKRDKTAEEILNQWCAEGLLRVGKDKDEKYIDRVAYELTILKEKDVLDYFVIFGEIVRWARDEGIRVAPGRGSAAGCLVSYLCRITTVDPIAYGLLFERFLNPDRVGMPDIDLDFQASMRQHVRDVFGQIHGEEKVADVVAHQTFKAKGGIRDVARVMNVDQQDVKLALVGIGDTDDLSEVLATSKALQSFRKQYPEVIKHALRLEGQVKVRSKHAAGVVITDGPITDYMPTMRARKDGPIVTAFSDKPSSPIISEYGFLKGDFLSTTDLDIQHYACEFLKRRGIDLDLDTLDVMHDPEAVDEKTMDLFRSGRTFGLFQFGGSPGIIGLMKAMKPRNIHDLSAVNALYRPGALDGGVTEDYIARRHNPDLITYWHPAVEPFLKHTCGIMIYQEQLMQVCVALGGFTPAQADDMRKATGKLYRLGKEEAKEFMAQYQAQWLSGTTRLQIPPDEAEDIWQKILAFGGYSFNASHSVSYSLESYAGAYLKANYPNEFYAALMKADPEKKTQAVREALAQGSIILPPDVNTSEIDMSLTPNGIRVGLITIKDVGDVAAQEVLEKRPFKDWEDFDSRIKKQRCNKRVITALFESGALDSLGTLPFTHIDQAAEERDRIGFSLTNNKVTELSETLSENIDTAKIERAAKGEYVVVGGEVVEIKLKIDKKGGQMAWATLAYGADTWKVTIFASMWKTYESVFRIGEVLLASVKVDDRGGFVLNAAGSAEAYKEAA